MNQLDNIFFCISVSSICQMAYTHLEEPDQPLYLPIFWGKVSYALQNKEQCKTINHDKRTMKKVIYLFAR